MSENKAEEIEKSKAKDKKSIKDFVEVKDAFKAYEDGKGRRYGLLFSVNGGAFAITKFFLADDKSPQILHGLNIYWLATRMILFTLLIFLLSAKRFFADGR